MKPQYKPFKPLLPPEPPRPLPHQPLYDKAAKRLFNEALTHYLQAMRRQNLLTRSDKKLILLAVHGLTRFNNYPLARALLQMSFSYLTADELLDMLEEARQSQREVECEIPF